MGDEDERGAKLLAQLLQQLQHRRLRRHVEGRGRLVEDDEVGLHGQGHGDHHALLHTAAGLVWVKPGRGLGVAQAHLREHLQRAAMRLLPGDAGMGGEDLRHLLAQRDGGVQGGLRLLVDHGDALPAQRPQLRLAHLEHVAAPKEHRSAADAPIVAQVAHDGEGERALARAALADDTVGLAAVEGQGNVAQGG